MCFTSVMFDEKSFVLEKKEIKEKKSGSVKWFSWQLFFFIVFTIIGLAAIGGGLYFLITTSNQTCISEETANKITLTTSKSATSKSATSKSAKSASQSVSNPASQSASLCFPKIQIYVDLAGAINKPGLYQLDAGSRLATVIKKAGGFTNQADPEFVSKQLNLAQKIKDGDKIYIISKKETEYQQQIEEFCSRQTTGQSTGQSSQTTNLTGSSNPTGSAQQEIDGQISINQASAKELESLDGIGEKRAADIIENRPYQQLLDLVEKKVISETIFNKIQNKLKL